MGAKVVFLPPYSPDLSPIELCWSKLKQLLLDEITVGQDPHSLALMLQVLQQFTQQGGALILTSHDPIAAEALQAKQITLSSVI